LVILDELGTGTSETDGTALAYSVLKHLLSVKCFIQFVTHYNALTSIENEFKGTVANYHMSYVQEKDTQVDSIVFLYKLAKGPAAQSFGCCVALMAGIPKDVTEEASARVLELEQKIDLQKIQEFHKEWKLVQQ